MIDLIGEQAGAIYDPYSKTLKGLLGLPASLRTPPGQRMILSHELCHALQDRVIDIAARSRSALDNTDYSYALRSTIEGMATVVMLASYQGLQPAQVHDARATMRASFAQKEGNPAMKAFAQAPRYLRESLLSPYAEGSAFAQAWLGAHPDLKMGAMLEAMPVSAEQVLHFEKYVEGDLPTAVDLSGLAASLPAGWRRFYANTFGEFDLLVLFDDSEATSEHAQDLASGWDGLRVEAYEDSSGQAALVGASAWDTEADAAEFEEGFSKVLAGVHPAGDFKVARRGNRVDFVVGPLGEEATSRMLAALAEANATVN
jgi:hypothetical protein